MTPAWPKLGSVGMNVVHPRVYSVCRPHKANSYSVQVARSSRTYHRASVRWEVQLLSTAVSTGGSTTFFLRFEFMESLLALIMRGPEELRSLSSFTLTVGATSLQRPGQIITIFCGTAAE